jgi:hypothetical protein
VKALEDAPEKFPPERWFAAVADGRPQRVAFRDINGDAELVRAEWSEENIFELKESPLLVDGVAIYDFVEVEWRDGSIEPHFLRCVPEYSWGCRAIRTRVSEKEVKKFLRVCDEINIRSFEGARYERGIFVTAIRPDAIQYYRELDMDVLYLLPGEWFFTDTGTRE